VTGAEEESVDLSLASLTMDEIMKLLVEAEEYVKHFSRNVSDIRAELSVRVERGDPYDFVVKLDGEDRMGMTVTVTKVKGAERWKYNPKAVMNRLEEYGMASGFTKRSLDTSTFNKALTNNEDIYEQFLDVVRRDRSPDHIQIKGLDKLLKARGMK